MHGTDGQSHSDCATESQIQVLVPDVPSDWQPPTLTCTWREVGDQLDPSPTGHAVWCSSAPTCKETGVLKRVESEDEECQHPEDTQQDDLEDCFDERELLGLEGAEGHPIPLALTPRWLLPDG